MVTDVMTGTAQSNDDPFHSLLSNEGRSLADMSAAAPVLVVFLRHLGCTFCREALADLSAVRKEILGHGVGIALVHMALDDDAAILFRKFNLADLPRIADAEQRLYRAFGLGRATLRSLMAAPNLRRAMQSGLHHGVGLLRGDAYQMPGVFVVDQGRAVASHVHRRVSDRPNYLALVRQAATGPGSRRLAGEQSSMAPWQAHRVASV